RRCRIRTSVHLEHLGGKAVVRHEMEELAVEPVDKAELAHAEPRRAFGNHVEHGLDVARKTADDVEHLASRGLVFKSLCQLIPRLCQLACESGNLLLEIGGGNACTRLCSLRLIRALPFHRLSACTVSLHVAPYGAFTTMLNPRQILGLPLWQDVRFGW